MTDREKADVLNGRCSGKAIQSRAIRHFCQGRWVAEETFWTDTQNPEFNFSHYEYRVKPGPVKPREWWINVYSDRAMAHNSEIEANSNARFGMGYNSVHVREVLPSEGN